MSERQPNYSEYERQSISPALDLFRSDLNVLTNEISLGMAFQNYIRAELNITETEADMLHRHMLQKGVVAEASDFDDGLEELKNEYRIAIFTDIRPLYLHNHTTDKYDEWLPVVLKSMLMDNNRHDVDICYRTNGRNATECEQGRCPIRVIEDETTRTHVSPNFDSLEYMIDPDKMHRQAEILLTHAVKYRVIPVKDVRSLESCYERQCKERFGSIR